MLTITQELHSGCVAEGVTPIQGTSDNSDLYFISGFGGAASVTPSLHKIVFSGGKIVDNVYAETGGTAPSWTFSNTISSSRTLLANVTQTTVNGVAQPVFTYYSYSNGVLSNTPLTTPLSTGDAASTNQVAITFVAEPSSGNTALDRNVTLSDSVVLRLSPASPATATDAPCS
jgi:hypothetical protein